VAAGFKKDKLHQQIRYMKFNFDALRQNAIQFEKHSKRHKLNWARVKKESRRSLF
jgi:hypothetical protein